MRGRSKVVAGLAVLVAISYFAWPSEKTKRRTVRADSQSQRAEKDEPRALEEDLAPEEIVRENNEEEEITDELDEEDEDEDGFKLPSKKLQINGRVFENNVPSPGATIIALTDTTTPKPLASTTADGEGRFTLEASARRGVRLEATKDERLRGAVLYSPYFGAKEARIDLKHAAQLAVTVLDRRDGSPVEGARVSGQVDEGGQIDLHDGSWYAAQAERRLASAPTGPDGKTMVPVLHPGEYEIEAEHDALGVVVVRKKLGVQNDPAPLTLELAGASSLFGRVVGEDGAPVAKVGLSLSPKDESQNFGYRSANTDQEGHFRIRGVEAGNYQLRTTSSAHLATTIDVVKKDDTNDLEVELIVKKGEWIEGRVVDRNDAPVAGISLHLTSNTGYSSRRTVSKDDGFFRFENLKPDTFNLGAVREATESPISFLHQEHDRMKVKSGDHQVILRISLPASLAVEIELRGAAPPESFELSIDGDERLFPATTTELFVDNLSAGEKEISLRAKGFAPVNRKVTLVEGSTVSAAFELRTENTLRGRVIDRKTGAPIGRAGVMALVANSEERDGTLRPSTVYTTNDGAFVLDGLPHKTLRIVARAKAHVQETVGPIDAAAQAEPIIIALTPGVTVSGQVRLGAKTLEYGTVTIGTETDQHLSMASLSRDGSFAFENAPTGQVDLEIMASSEKGSKQKRISIEVPESGVRNVKIDFDAGNTRLVLSLPPSSGEHRFISLESAAGSRWMSSTLDPDRAVFEGLSAGEYSLTVMEMDSFAEEPAKAQKLSVTIPEGQSEAYFTVPPN
jgi:protocatechuate 3,4-dioxygenase beta subunit